MEEGELGLIKKAQGGDKDAFGKLYELFYKRIYRYCKFNLGREEAAEDICQETFLKAWKSLRSFSIKRGGTFQAFLFKIARNLIIDLSRKKKEYSIDEYLEISSDQELEQDFDAKEQERIMRHALLKLDETDRQIILLRYFEEMDSRDVAEVIGVRDGALRVRTHRILRKLRKILGSYGR